jgi:hypothetical protein
MEVDMSTTDTHIFGCLYDRQADGKLNNVKFYRGDADLIRAEDFKEENRKIDAQKRSGNVTPDCYGPRVTKPKMDFRAMFG